MKSYTKGNVLQNAITMILLTCFYGQNSDNEILITSMTRHAEIKFSIEWINEETSLTDNIFSSSILWICYLLTSLWKDYFLYVFSLPISDLSGNYLKSILTALSVT
jgi:hypothetical protein